MVGGIFPSIPVAADQLDQILSITWSGTTNRNYPMSFNISDTGTRVTKFKLKTNWSYGSSFGTVEISKWGSWSSNSGNFASTTGTFTFDGTFDSATTSTGNYDFIGHKLLISTYPYFQYYYFTQNGTWSATGSEFGSTAPIVDTGSATSVGAYTAVLNGTVNPNGESTTYYFDYGTSTAYGSTTLSTSAGSGTSNVAANGSISGLSAETTYHYRLVATNSSGTTLGDDKTFTTSEAAQGGVISLNRSHLRFGATTSGAVTGEQKCLISNMGQGVLNWAVSDNQNWLICSPTAGTESGILSVSVNPTGLSAGTYTGSVTVSDSNATNSPQSVTVTLNVLATGQSSPPFGNFATPLDNANASSSIPVTGWVLDDVGVDSVKIYNGTSYIGDAILVEGARPDVEASYPGYPVNHLAGWGYMLLTNFLPNGGNGNFTLNARATDKEGNTVNLGSKTIICDNANAVKPFGAIDTPAQGGMASGSSFINWGWALSPHVNGINVDGSTINVFVDGVNLGHPNYNIYRADIATLFPGYFNSNGAVGYFFLDTSAYENGVHTIQWTVKDKAGQSDGIGSRYFSVVNTSSNRTAVSGGYFNTSQLGDFPVTSSPLLFKSGINRQMEMSRTSASKAAKTRNAIIMEEAELMTICLGNTYTDYENNLTVKVNVLGTKDGPVKRGKNREVRRYWGYQVVGDQLRVLPVGSHLDIVSGIFSWQPGAAFLGRYELVFITERTDGSKTRRHIPIQIVPRR